MNVGIVYDDVIAPVGQIDEILAVHIYHIHLFSELPAEIDMPEELEPHIDDFRGDLDTVDSSQVVLRQSCAGFAGSEAEGEYVFGVLVQQNTEVAKRFLGGSMNSVAGHLNVIYGHQERSVGVPADGDGGRNSFSDRKHLSLVRFLQTPLKQIHRD